MNWKAIIIGIACYPPLWLVWLLLSPDYQHQSITLHGAVFYAYLLLIPAVCGYVAGRVAGSDHVSHGLVTGVGILAISVALWVTIGALGLRSACCCSLPWAAGCGGGKPLTRITRSSIPAADRHLAISLRTFGTNVFGKGSMVCLTGSWCINWSVRPKSALQMQHRARKTTLP